MNEEFEETQELRKRTPTWNMQQQYYARLDRLITYYQFTMIQDDYLNGWDTLQQIYEMLTPLLTTTETKDMEDSIEKVNFLLQMLNKAKENRNGQVNQNVILYRIKQYCRNTNIKLMGIMYKYNMLFPKAPITGLEAIDQAYGVGTYARKGD